jgi:cytochrome oxidase Cu insertion factor (SCO1/SenC/PrrC family)
MKKLLPIFLLIAIGLCANAHSAIHGQRTGPVAVGEVAPDFTLQDQSANKVTLSDARGKSPVVLVFYRGYW